MSESWEIKNFELSYRPPHGTFPGNSFTIPGARPLKCENCGKQVAKLHSSQDVIEDDGLYEVHRRDATEVWISHTPKRCSAWRQWSLTNEESP